MLFMSLTQFDSGVKAVPRCTMCGWSLVLHLPSDTTPKQVTERANEEMNIHLREKHGVFDKSVSKGKRWI